MALNDDYLEWSLKLLASILIIFMISGPAISAIITVNPGESIQAAIDKASSGDIIKINSGTYKENIDINKRLTLQGIDNGNGKPTISSGNGDNNGVITLSAGGCSICGLLIDGLENNALTILSNSNNVSDNIISGDNCRVYLNKTKFNNISNNIIDIGGIRHHGILLLRSFNNTIENNTILSNGLMASGIDLASSTNNTIIKNQINGNGWLGRAQGRGWS